MADPARHIDEMVVVDHLRATRILLEGDAVPYHLRMDAPPLAICDRCKRQTWASGEVGSEDRMRQPDGNPCGGRLVANTKGTHG